MSYHGGQIITATKGNNFTGTVKVSFAKKV